MKNRRTYRKVKMSDYKKIYQLYIQNKSSLRKIEELLTIPKSTLSDYISRIMSLKMSRDEFEQLSEQEIHTLIFPNKELLKDNPRLPDFNQIDKELKRPHVTIALLYQEYSYKNPNIYSYSHYCKLYKDWQIDHKITMRQNHVPGEKLFIDYAGPRIPITDKLSGKVLNKQLFVSCLGMSGYLYVEVSNSQGTLDFCNSIVNSLNYYKGVPKILVPDNLKSAVINANFYDPKFNASFEELANYYGTLINPARVRKPKDKAKVENSVLIVERWIIAKIRHLIFYNLAEANTVIKEYMEQINNKVMKQYGKSRKELYLEYEVRELKELPKEPFIPRLMFKCKVPFDYHIVYNHRYYSVPYKYINQEVIGYITDKNIEIFSNKTIIATHLIIAEFNGKSTKKEHMLVQHRETCDNNVITEDALLARAEKIGQNTCDLIKEIIRSTVHPIYQKRRCLGILRSAERIDVDNAEQASAYFMNIPDKKISIYRVIIKNKSYLQSNNRDNNYSENCTMKHNNLRGEENYK